jgi:sugar phosphate isomerase/epimerase
MTEDDRMYELPLARSVSFKDITEELAKNLTDAGIVSVEVSPGGVTPVFGTDDDLALVDSRLEILKSRGARVLSFHLPFGWDWDASTTTYEHHRYLLDRQLRIADIFLRMEPERFVLHPCYWPIPESETGIRVRHIRENAETIARVTGKDVAIENLKIGRIGGSSEELLKLGERLEHVGYCVDMNHFMRERAEDAIRKLGKHILTLHVSDYDFIDERHWLPGEGLNDWNAILKALEDVGYQGPFLYEVRADYSCAAVAENYRRLFDTYNRA